MRYLTLVLLLFAGIAEAEPAAHVTAFSESKKGADFNHLCEDGVFFSFDDRTVLIFRLP